MATKVYRDYGALNGMSAPNNEFDLKRYTQVYQATHEGERRLPFMNRSFISFSFGERLDKNGVMRPVYIEDFNLIAYTKSDSLDRDAYGSFSDLTSEYDVIQGQFYWGTFYHTNSLSLDLVTDGITQRELDDFKYWFRAGVVRELILAEHPNRAIMARVSSTPKLQLLPFEQRVEMPFDVGNSDDNFYTEKIYHTSTTLYRGEITLEFVMDEPFWYAKQNILGTQNVVEGYYDSYWTDANGQLVDVKSSEDALKIIYEDHIPLGSSTNISVFLGGDIYASVKYHDYSKIAKELLTINDQGEKVPDQAAYEAGIAAAGGDQHQASAFIAWTENNITRYYQGGAIAQKYDGNIDDEQNDNWLGAIIAGAAMNDNTNPQSGIELPANGDPAYLYYAGNAPSPVKLTFTMVPQINAGMDQNNDRSALGYYIIVPKSKYTNVDEPYNTITLTASMEHKFKFTLPTFWLNYNQVLQIFDNDNIIRAGNAWLTVRETIRDTIRHPVIRAWANRLIDAYDSLEANGSGIIASHIAPKGENESDESYAERVNNYYESLRANLKEGMSLLLTNNTGTPFSATFIFDGKTGEALGQFTYRDVSLLESLQAPEIINDEIQFDSLSSQIRNTVQNNVEYTITKTENVGDMVKSSYLILDERNVLNDKFQVQAWSELHPDYAYKIEHDVENGLENLHFRFNNMYL